MDWKSQAILVTGGTGSFGKKFVEIALQGPSSAKDHYLQS